jgi:hypothetical protein
MAGRKQPYAAILYGNHAGSTTPLDVLPPSVGCARRFPHVRLEDVALTPNYSGPFPAVSAQFLARVDDRRFQFAWPPFSQFRHLLEKPFRFFSHSFFRHAFHRLMHFPLRSLLSVLSFLQRRIFLFPLACLQRDLTLSCCTKLLR